MMIGAPLPRADSRAATTPIVRLSDPSFCRITLFGYESVTSGYNLPGIAQSGKGSDKTSGLHVTAGKHASSRNTR